MTDFNYKITEFRKAIDKDTGEEIEYVSKSYISKAQSTNKERVLRFVISDESIDRDNEKIIQSGWNFKNYKSNPVLLSNHDLDGFSHGKAVKISKDTNTKKTYVDFEFAPPEVSSVADTYFKLYKNGYMNAVSVGFIPNQDKIVFGKSAKEPRVTYNEQELYEVSLVTVPANANALRTEKGIKKALEDGIVDDLEITELELYIKNMTDETISKDVTGDIESNEIDFNNNLNSTNKEIEIQINKNTQGVTNKMENQDLINKAVEASLQAFEKRQAEKLEADKVKALEAEKETIKAELDALKKAPAFESGSLKGTGAQVGAPDVYKGFNFKAQGKQADICPSDPKEADAVRKGIIDVFAPFSKNESIRKAVMTSSTHSDVIPITWYDSLILKAHEISVALNACRRFPIVEGNTMYVPTANAGTTLTYTAENAALTESQPTVTKKTLTAGKYGLRGSLTQELLDDPMTDIMSYVSYDVINTVGQGVDDLVFNGDSYSFTGILGNADTTITFGASNTATSYANMTSKNFLQAITALTRARGRMGAKFYLPKELLATIMELKFGSSDSPLMNINVNTGMQTIYGYGVEEVEAIDGTDGTATNFVAFCNLMNYALGVRSMTNAIEVNPYGGSDEWNKDIVLYKFRVRLCGTPIFTDHFVDMATA